jgi:hypothetical protein
MLGMFHIRSTYSVIDSVQGEKGKSICKLAQHQVRMSQHPVVIPLSCSTFAAMLQAQSRACAEHGHA